MDPALEVRRSLDRKAISKVIQKNTIKQVEIGTLYETWQYLWQSSTFRRHKKRILGLPKHRGSLHVGIFKEDLLWLLKYSEEVIDAMEISTKL
jgi:hypothetical protein